MTKSESLFQEALNLLPGGVDSPVRAFKAVGGGPRFIKSADGCYLTDVDGKQYIDYIGSWGPMILGHCEPGVTAALVETIKAGTSFGAPSEGEVELAREITRRVPSVELVRFVNSGTEATMSAIRLARAATKRPVIVKFSGGYHGHADSFLIQAGSGVATFGTPDSPGVTLGAAQDTRVAQYNNLESVESLFAAEPGEIAAVIVEPVAGNVGVIPPEPGFLAGLRDICSKFGALLIFDEVMTGFRVAMGGAQELYGVKPDLTTFGKVIGGGLPVGAYGGRRDLMQMIAPSGPVYQAGTLSGNPLAMRAGIETLKRLTPETYLQLERSGKLLEEGLLTALRDSDTVGCVQRVGSMITLFFHAGPLRNYEEVKLADHQKFAQFFRGMLERGVHLPPSGYEASFISTCHTSEEIGRTVKAARETLATI